MKTKAAVALFPGSLLTMAATMLVLLCVTFVGVGIAQAQSLVGGNSVVGRQFIDSFDNFYLVDTNNPINANGHVTAFEVFVATLQPVTLVIYRKTGSVFSVVGTSGQKSPPIVGFNQFQLSTPIAVQAGDFVGLLNSSVVFTLDPPFSFSLGNLSGTMLFTANNSGNPPSHTNANNFTGSSNRTYSVRAIGTPDQTCVQPPPELISWWPGDGDASDIQDTNDGTLQGGVTFDTGFSGQAFSFDGTGEVNISDNSNLNVQAFTVDAWVFPTILDGDVDIILNKEVLTPQVFTIQYEIGVRGSLLPNLGTIPFGNLAFFINVSGRPNDFQGWVNGFAAVPLNTWTHVGLTFDGSTAKAYVNGALTRTISGLSGSIPTTPGPLKIGARGGPTGVSNFTGLIDEVEIYNRALMAWEIQAIFNAGRAGKCKPVCIPPHSGLVSWWDGDGDASDIQDGNDGTLQNGATFAPGFVTSGTGQAFSFDGLDDFVSIDHNNNLNVASHTIEAWIRTPDFLPSTFLTILSKTTPEPIGRNFGLFIEHSGVQAPRTPGALLGSFTNGPNNFIGLHGNTVVTDGNFHHVAVTYDAPSRTMRLYVDAMLDAETTLAPGTFPDTHTLPASIGADLVLTGARLFFNGLIDELEIYNHALSSAEILAIFNAGRAGKCKVAPNQPPVAQCQDVAVSADNECLACASVDDGSFDPDGDPITVIEEPGCDYSLGSTLVTLTVDDGLDSDSCQGTVTVVDTTPPSIQSVAASPSVLWPPNHKMVPVIVSASVSDFCDTTPVCQITSVSSNEPINGRGDGNTSPDWEITGDLRVNLRAERSGSGTGRIYTIAVQCTDASGNRSTAAVPVEVPHDRGKGNKK